MRKQKSNRASAKACTRCTAPTVNARNSRQTTTHPLPKISNALSTKNNRKIHWKHYQHIQKQINNTWASLQTAVQQKAKPGVILAYRNHLLLLLGECNYLAHEYMKLIHA